MSIQKNGASKLDYVDIGTEISLQLHASRVFNRQQLHKIFTDVSAKSYTEDNSRYPWKYRGLVFGYRTLNTGIYASEDLPTVRRLLQEIVTSKYVHEFEENQATLLAYLTTGPIVVPKEHRAHRCVPFEKPSHGAILFLPLGRHREGAELNLPEVLVWSGTVLDYAPVAEISQGLLEKYALPDDIAIRRKATVILRRLLQQISYAHESKGAELLSILL